MVSGSSYSNYHYLTHTFGCDFISILRLFRFDVLVSDSLCLSRFFVSYLCFFISSSSLLEVSLNLVNISQNSVQTNIILINLFVYRAYFKGKTIIKEKFFKKK